MADESFVTAYMDMPKDLSSSNSRLYIFSVENFAEWYQRIYNAHERELKEARRDAGCAYLDDMPDEMLAEHGLVRLPVDADGVRWTGEERFFQDAQVGGARFLFGLSYFGDGKWEIIDHYQNEAGAAPAMCRHVTDKPADPHKELADELEVKASTAPYDEAGWRDYVRDIAGRLREMGGADADAKR